MKRSLLSLPVLCLLVLPTMGLGATTTLKKPALHNVHRVKAVTAPADEYFGHQKYSILGIRNALHDLNIRYDGTVGRTPFLYSNAAGIEDAMHDWDKKYHGDLWLAHYLFQLDQIYMRVPAELGHQKVDSLSQWIIGAYPKTYYGRYLTHIRNVHAQVAKATVTAAPVPTSTPLAPLPTASLVPQPLPTATVAPTM